jgi:hypothetical protein
VKSQSLAGQCGQYDPYFAGRIYGLSGVKGEAFLPRHTQIWRTMYNDRMAGKAVLVASVLSVAPHEPVCERVGSYPQE